MSVAKESVTSASKEEIFEQIKSLLEELFEIDPSGLTMDTNLYPDLDLDSIDLVDLMVELKKYAGKKVSPEDFKEVRTLGDVVDVIHDLMQE